MRGAGALADTGLAFHWILWKSSFHTSFCSLLWGLNIFCWSSLISNLLSGTFTSPFFFKKLLCS